MTQRRTRKKPDPSRIVTLGWEAIHWIETYLVHGPGDVQGDPIVLDDEQARFILRAYELDAHGRRRVRRAFFSRPKGRAKSELAGMLVCFEALGPARFSHWGDDGEPVGKPVTYPFIRCLATEESQAGNTYDNVRFMLNHIKDQFPDVYPGIDVGLTRTNLPGGGEIVPSTAASASKDGGKETFAVADETHLYNSPELRRMHETVRRNMAKRKAAEPWMLDTSTMYSIGEDSIAEATHKLFQAIREGRASDPGLLFDHRQAPEVDLSNAEELRKALIYVYGPASEWMPLDTIIAECQDPMTRPSDAKRYFLNQPSTDSDRWMDAKAWHAAAAPERLAIGTTVTLGFDGSRIDDSTALVATRVSDGKVFEVALWERPPGELGNEWSVPRVEVDDVVQQSFGSFDVRFLYADPSGWQSYLDKWAALFPNRIVEVFPSSQQKLMKLALDRFLADTVDGVLRHDGSSGLTRHVLNAVPSRNGQIKKPRQVDKIDAAVAAVLSYLARAEALKSPAEPVVDMATQVW